MSHLAKLKQIDSEITSYLPHLGKCMSYVLAMYVLGTVMMRHCGQSRIAALLSRLTGSSFGAMKQRLREFTYAGPDKRGRQRRTVEVKSCFGGLMTWVLSKFEGKDKQVVLAMDATYLGDRFIILAVSVVVAGSAIPVAWHIQSSEQQGSWQPFWMDMLARLKPSIPTDWTVFVLSDSGLYSKQLFTYLNDLQWYALMRIDWSQALFQHQARMQWHPIRHLVHQGMVAQALAGHCFKTNPLACTLVLQWGSDYQNPCVLVSNLPPAEIQHNVYAIRYWIECGFKDIKRGLFHWEHTKMMCPRRAERLWLVISIALLWLTALGDAASVAPRWQSLHQARPTARILSAPLLGWIDFLLTFLQQDPFTFGFFNPYPWLPLPNE